jgi:hypothetical protein
MQTPMPDSAKRSTIATVVLVVTFLTAPAFADDRPRFPLESPRASRAASQRGLFSGGLATHTRTFPLLPGRESIASLPSSRRVDFSLTRILSASSLCQVSLAAGGVAGVAVEPALYRSRIGLGFAFHIAIRL